jgi:hypothetical protein
VVPLFCWWGLLVLQYLAGGENKNTLSDKSQKSLDISIKNLEKVQKSHLKILASIPLLYSYINYIISLFGLHISLLVS